MHFKFWGPNRNSGAAEAKVVKSLYTGRQQTSKVSLGIMTKQFLPQKVSIAFRCFWRYISAVYNENEISKNNKNSI